jgi:hypothetical protein
MNAQIISSTVRQRANLIRAGRRLAGSAIDKLRRAADSTFDVKYGTDTAHWVQLKELSLSSKNVAHGQFYEPTPIRVFNRAMTSLKIAHGEFTFIDFGSGKGRNLLLASHYPFREIIGVEFSQELHQIAENNIAIYNGRGQKCSRIRSLCVDAVDYALPSTNLIAFFFNPFNEVVFAEVLSNMRAFGKGVNKLCIIYCEARCSSLLENSGLLPYQKRLTLPYIFTRRPGWINSLNVYSNFPLV